MLLWQFPTKIAQKPWLHFFTNFSTKAQKANTPNLAKPKPNPDNFVLQPNFSHLILHTFVTIPHQDCSKTMISVFDQFCYQGTKRQYTQLGSAKTQPKSIPFATKLLTPHFGCICDNSPPRLLKTHDFTFSPILLPRHKKPIHPSWLSQNPTKINSFCNKYFHTSFCIHLWQFSMKIAQKPWPHFLTNFATKAQKANPPNLVKTKPNQDQFLLQPNFWHLILDAFQTIPHQDYSKTMTSLFHQFCYRDTNSESTQLS